MIHLGLLLNCLSIGVLYLILYGDKTLKKKYIKEFSEINFDMTKFRLMSK